MNVSRSFDEAIMPLCESGRAEEPAAMLKGQLATHRLQAPFFPPHSRGAFIALRAFNAELAGVNEAVSSGKPLIGQMRFQWWREAIKGCYDVRRLVPQTPSGS